MNDMSAERRWAWAASLAPAAAILPGAAARAGAGGWIAPVLALPLILAAEPLLEGVDARAFGRVLGKWGGRALTIIYIMWAVVLGGVQLRVSVRRLESAAVLPAEPWVLKAGVILLALWMARGKAAACARWSRLVLKGLLAGLGAVALLALRQVRWNELLPLWDGGEGIPAAAAAAFAVLCVRVYGGFVPCGHGGRSAKYAVPVCAVLGSLLLTVQGNLGADLAARLEDPLLTLSRNVGVEGAFQRAESLLAALLLLADLALLTLLLWWVRSAVGRAWPAAGAAIFAAASLPMTAEQTELLRYEVIPAGNFAVGLVIPLILFVLGRVKGRKKGAYIVPENGENSIS